ncbi:peptidoglycan DD-metalloendopeptidase family protein [Candidatus Nomurabacteria bacterium]|nr:peptidoglycan DD-metalloendopeptidase family protein [Candidatus Nomurabacteria bacterium]
MKQYRDYKKLFSIVALLALFSVPLVFSRAETAQEVRDKINQKSADIAEIERQIKEYQTELNSLGKQKSSLSGSIKELDITKKKLNADISLTQNKIDKTNLQIKNLTGDIGDKESSINTNTNSIKLEIRNLNEYEDATFLETFLSNDDFTVIWNDIDNIMTVRESLREHIARLKETKTILEDTRDKTVEAKNELTRLKTQLSDQQKIVIQNTNAKNKLLAQTKNSEATYQKLVAEQLAKKIAFEKELEGYESQLKFILDPSKLPSGRVLSWPLDSIFVTSPYAPRWGGFHRGTDFRAAVGTQVKSVADGVVKGIGDTDICCPGASFGKWIFVEHNNGLSSTYAHLSLIKVSAGQKVSRGSIIGYSGNTGSSTGPHLHLSVYVSNGVKVDSFASKSYPGKILTQPISATEAYLDPMDYLPPYK